MALAQRALRLWLTVVVFGLPAGLFGPVPWGAVPVAQVTLMALSWRLSLGPANWRLTSWRCLSAIGAYVVLAAVSRRWDPILLSAAALPVFALCVAHGDEGRANVVAAAVLVLLLGAYHGLGVATHWIDAVVQQIQECAYAAHLQGATRVGPSTAGFFLAAYALAHTWQARVAAGGALSASAWVIAAGIVTMWARSAWQGLSADVDVWSLGAAASVQAMALCLLASAFTRAGDGEHQRPTARRWPSLVRAAAAIVAVAGLGTALACAWQVHQAKAEDQGTFAVLNEGLLDWDRPIVGKYGIHETGMFGMLPDYVDAMGWQFETITRDELATGALSRVSILCIINLGIPLSEEQAQHVLRFVADGGGLLLLGDHTDIKGVMRASNALLGDLGISFRFDSAYPNSHGGAGLFVLRPGTVTRGLTRRTEMGIGVGASLAVTSPAYPVVTGVSAFSDRGIRENVMGAMLGNYRFDAGELYGDIVYVAARDLGRGRVLVFGDTSPFQNGCLAYTTRLFNNVVTALTRRSWTRAPLAIAVALCGALAALLCGLGYRRTRVGAVGGVVGFACVWGLTRLPPATEQVEIAASRPVLVIDLSHTPLVDRYMDLELSLCGLESTAQRAGYRTVVCSTDLERAVERLNASAVVSVAPTSPFSADETQSLARYVRAGGLLMIAGGWHERTAMATVLHAFGADVGGVPLTNAKAVGGRVFDRLDVPTFVDAYPVVSTTDTPLTALYSYSGYDVIGCRAYGSGKFILIGDARFPTAANTEGISGFQPANIELVIRLLGHAW